MNKSLAILLLGILSLTAVGVELKVIKTGDLVNCKVYVLDDAKEKRYYDLNGKVISQRKGVLAVLGKSGLSAKTAIHKVKVNSCVDESLLITDALVVTTKDGVPLFDEDANLKPTIVAEASTEEISEEPTFDESLLSAVEVGPIPEIKPEAKPLANVEAKAPPTKEVVNPAKVAIPEVKNNKAEKSFFGKLRDYMTGEK